MHTENIRKILPLYGVILISGVLYILSLAGVNQLARHNILYPLQGENKAVVINTPFVCELSFDAAAVSGKPVCSLSDKTNAPVIELFNRIIHENGRKQIVTDISHPAGRAEISSRWGNSDNPRGTTDIRLVYEYGKLSVHTSERCDIYVDMFAGKKYNETVVLPEINSVKLNEQYACKLEISRCGSWKKWHRLFQIFSHFFLIVFIASLITAAMEFFCRRDTRTGNGGKKGFSGTLSAAAVFITTGILWSFMSSTVPEVDLSQYAVEKMYLNPEPKEQFLYIFVLIFSSCTLLAANMFLPESEIFSSGRWNRFAGACAGILLLISCRESGFTDMKNGFVSGYILLLFAAAAAVLLLQRKWKNLQKYRFLPMAAALFYLCTFFKTYLLRNFDFFDGHHYSAFLHPVWTACSGFSPFDIPSTYGAYAFFLLPYFKLTGLSSAAADILVCGLIAITGVLMYQALRKLFITRFWCWAALAASAGLFAWNGTPSVYPQYMPLRTVFFALLLFIISRNAKDALCFKNCITGTVISTVAVLWNFDSGVVLFIAWCLYLAAVFVTGDEKRKLLSILSVPVSAAAVIAVCAAIHFMIYGKMPDFNNLFSTSLLFGKTGLLQLPMPYFGVWMVPAGIYFAALCYCAAKAAERRFSGRDALILFIALYGCGIFSYYAGRSHSGNLLNIMYPAVILTAAAAEKIRNRNWYIMRFAAIFLLICISLRGVNVCRKLFETNNEQLFYQRYFNRLCGDVEKKLPENRRLLYSGYQESLLAVELGAKALFPHPSLEESVLKKDCSDYGKYIRCPEYDALWTVNMKYVNKDAPPMLRRLLLEQIKLRMPGNIPDNAMLMFHINKAVPLNTFPCQKQNIR